MLPYLFAGLGAGLPMLTNPVATRVLPPAAAAAAGWPPIQPLHAEYAYLRPAQPDGDTPFIVYLKGAKETPLYKFECHSGNYADDYEMHFSGDFQCALFPFKGDTVTLVNLLATETHAEQDHDWWNRGRVLARQFQGECLDYPEYSTARHFRLRDMAVTLAFTDIQWQAGKLAKFILTFDVVQDPDAKGPMIQAPEGDAPPSACYPGRRPDP